MPSLPNTAQFWLAPNGTPASSVKSSACASVSPPPRAKSPKSV
jgi:hypothetical protein